MSDGMSNTVILPTSVVIILIVWFGNLWLGWYQRPDNLPNLTHHSLENTNLTGYPGESNLCLCAHRNLRSSEHLIFTNNTFENRWTSVHGFHDTLWYNPLIMRLDKVELWTDNPGELSSITIHVIRWMMVLLLRITSCIFTGVWPFPM